MYNPMLSEIPEVQFVVEIDKLKSIVRKTKICTGERLENTAEHSWHLATSVWVLRDYSNEKIDLERALKMALAHDIVEIDAGDTFVYDTSGAESKAAREKKAAERLFNLVPSESLKEMNDLWYAYEDQKCVESKFVNALDRFLPILSNYLTDGHSWTTHKIRRNQVVERNKKIEHGSKKLWAIAQKIIATGVENKWLLAD